MRLLRRGDLGDHRKLPQRCPRYGLSSTVDGAYSQWSRRDGHSAAAVTTLRCFIIVFCPAPEILLPERTVMAFLTPQPHGPSGSYVNARRSPEIDPRRLRP